MTDTKIKVEEIAILLGDVPADPGRGEPMTLGDIGRALGVSDKRVDQIKREAFDKLRRNPRVKRLYEQSVWLRNQRRRSGSLGTESWSDQERFENGEQLGVLSAARQAKYARETAKRHAKAAKAKRGGGKNVEDNHPVRQVS